MKIAIGCDHIVTDIKDKVVEMLQRDKIEVVDCGTYDFQRTHYPIFGNKVASKVAQKEVDFGIVICGTGVGISNGAQKTKGARVLLAKDVISVVDARQNYDANVIGFGGRIVGLGLMYEMIEAFINTKYANKNQDLIKKIDNLIVKPNYDENMFGEELKKWDEGFYTD
ncbi:RpiB/LacA/LacB family sugar-phosphate isomerase [Spiroplasma clarkii]|uniref:Galactose-6-phosphate isomerase n=1 Tax=Spiroplasma clarkii TaxID=2139 RepID=A0A2K8KFG3_9MOLU|nr:RpiB/LacA/LacB family sugar-phosphate isomerase [Spiroplasma clarkii]ATX70428.1 galactose-6-phosphate isomerase [Spiroplasma clarkii]